MSRYNTRVTIVCPEAMIADANQLALMMGENKNDDQTFLIANWEDNAGNKYAVSSTVATSTFAAKASSTLILPSHGSHADLAAAQRAQQNLYIFGVHGANSADPDRIWAFVEPAPGNASAAISMAGLTRLENQISEFPNE